MQPKQTQKFISIPINLGSKPNFNTRLGYPQIFNYFYTDNALYSTPWLKRKTTNDFLKNARAIIKSQLLENTYYVVNDVGFFKVDRSGFITQISRIHNTLLSVQIDANQQNQIGFVDGRNFYVYSEKTQAFIIMGGEQGFVYKNPISIVVLNNICVVMDVSGKWAISDANNMVSFPTIDSEQALSGNCGDAKTLQTCDDNLFILGSLGIEKWIPSSGNNAYLFPFGKDNSFRCDSGAIAVNSSQLGFNEVYILGSDFIPRVLTTRGINPIGDVGMAKIISSYPDTGQVTSSFYQYLGNYFFHLYFPLSKNSWIYCTNSKVWGNGDDHITCSAPRLAVVATEQGIFDVTGDIDYAISKKRIWQSERVFNYKGLEPYRMSLNGVEAKIVQGFKQSSVIEPQHMRLNISLDSESWLNPVTKPIGRTGKREDITTWSMNLCGHEFTLNLQYQGTYNLIIEKITAIIK